jgi:hypothetical protein
MEQDIEFLDILPLYNTRSREHIFNQHNRNIPHRRWSHMLITIPNETKTLHYYDITFEGGVGLNVTIDEKLGDTISSDSQAFYINLSEKPSKASPGTNLPAEEITAFKSKILSIQKRTLEVPVLSPEQEAEWKKTIQEVSRTIQ